MFRFNRNKDELIVLTAAIYSFVAYLTAFALEVLFLIDLSRQGDILTRAANPAEGSQGQQASHPLGDVLTRTSSSQKSLGEDRFQKADGQLALFDRMAFETLQAHITISCLAMAILYFVIFVTSLTLIVSLILRSTFMLLVWMCAMATMYLPEFGLVAYVSFYCWGLDTRNGQTEMLFFLFRAVLNFIFILRAHKLFKQWTYEKSFFRLKSGAGAFGAGHGSAVASQFTGYDSPYIIGDTLTTTINPVFSSGSGSTLNLNRYDYVRHSNHFNQQAYSGDGNAEGMSSRNTSSPATNISQNGNGTLFGAESPTTINSDSFASRHGLVSPAAGGRVRGLMQNTFTHELASKEGRANQSADRLRQHNKELEHHHQLASASILGNSLSPSPSPPVGQKRGKFYLGETAHSKPELNLNSNQTRRSSPLSIKNEIADYEMDLVYRTLSKPTREGRHRHYQPQARPYREIKTTTSGARAPAAYQRHNQHHNLRVGALISRSQDNLAAYSTRSLDRRNLKDFTLAEEVLLRPLGHQPFEYLHRPGSTSNLNSIGRDPKAASQINYHYHNYK